MIFFSIGGWAIAQELTDADQDERTATIELRQETISAATEVLQEIHLVENAKEAGAEAYRRKLCLDGRLTGDICEGD